MTRHFNRVAQTPKRRRLRHNATPAEQRLWQHLKGGQLHVKFRRQYSVDAYVIDFYVASHKLAIELDGDTHFTTEAIEYDRQRTAHLEGFGIEVLRVTNRDVFENIEGVLTTIGQAVRRRSNLP